MHAFARRGGGVGLLKDSEGRSRPAWSLQGHDPLRQLDVDFGLSLSADGWGGQECGDGVETLASKWRRRGLDLIPHCLLPPCPVISGLKGIRRNLRFGHGVRNGMREHSGAGRHLQLRGEPAPWLESIGSRDCVLVAVPDRTGSKGSPKNLTQPRAFITHYCDRFARPRLRARPMTIVEAWPCPVDYIVRQRSHGQILVTHHGHIRYRSDTIRGLRVSRRVCAGNGRRKARLSLSSDCCSPERECTGREVS